jgi:putative endonuclease
MDHDLRKMRKTITPLSKAIMGNHRWKIMRRVPGLFQPIIGKYGYPGTDIFQGATKTMIFVYLIECQAKYRKKLYYAGITNNPERRLEEHRSGKGARFLKGKAILRMIICHECRTIKEAMEREREIKQWSHDEKKKAISMHPSIC